MIWKILFGLGAIVALVLVLRKLPLSITKFLVALVGMAVVAFGVYYAYLVMSEEYGGR